MKEIRANLACELVPHDEEHTECKIRIEGSTDGLLHAFEQITKHLLESLVERYGKDIAMGMYASVQIEALKGAGINPDEEAAEAQKKLAKLRGLEAFKDIIGKTFKMPDKDGGAE